MSRKIDQRTSLTWAAGVLVGCAALAGGCSGDARTRAARPAYDGGTPTAWQEHYTIPVKIRSANGSVRLAASLMPFPAISSTVTPKGELRSRTLSGIVGESACAPEGATQGMAAFESSILVPLCGKSLSAADRAAAASFSGELPVWSDGLQYVWPAASDCDTALARMEYLLCSADKLLEWSEASENVEHDRPVPDDTGKETVLLPPLPADFRFVPRDLATYYLSQIPRMDLVRIPYASTCAAVIAAHPMSAYDAVGNQDFYAPPQNYSPEESEAIYEAYSTEEDRMVALRRARTLARLHILRSGSRLLEKAGRMTLDADRGIAERSMARATDPTDGAERYWGAALAGSQQLRVNDSVDPYNSVSHALSYFYGRWERRGEVPCSADDVHYSQVMALRLPNVSDRILSSPPRTAGARRAVQLLTEVGVVGLGPGTGSRKDVLGLLLAERRATGSLTVSRSLDDVTDSDLDLALRNLAGHTILAGANDDAAGALAGC